MKTILIKILTRSATLNPQNNVVHNALLHMGYTEAREVRVDRCFIIEVDDDTNVEALRERLKDDLKTPQFAGRFNPITDVLEFEIA